MAQDSFERIPILQYFFILNLPHLYCKDLQKDIDMKKNDYTMDNGKIHDVDWNHLLSTIDVWGK